MGWDAVRMGEDAICAAVDTMLAGRDPPWALPVVIIIFVYLVIGLLVLCDRYFVPTLQRIRVVGDIPDHVVGAILMGAGSSLTELFTSMADAFGTRNSIGFGTIAGASIFNLLGNAGVAAVLAGQDLPITPGPFIRDCIFYAGAATAMFYMLIDGQIAADECYMLLAAYAVYVIVVCSHRMIAGCFESPEDKSAHPQVSMDAPLLDEEVVVEAKEDILEQAAPEEVPLFDFMKFDTFQCLASPFSCLFGLTVPTPTAESGGLILTIGFIMSALWIAVISFGLAYSGSAIGCVAGINSALIGITLVATATTLSGVFASSIVAKRGHGDMAMSNALGSNIFCIFVGLGFPWFWSVVVIDKKPFQVDSDTRDVIVSAGAWLGGTLLIVMLMVAGNGFTLTPRIGGFMLFMYFAFVCFMVAQEVIDPS